MKIALFCISLSISCLSFASEPLLSKQFDACMNTAAGGETFEMLECISAETRRQDALLNAAYKSALQPLTKNRRAQLQEAQRAWMKFRDANCSFYADPDGGTSASVLSSDCFLTATANRAKELEDFAK